eukprot:CAMPEP_0196138640 /NCGR_PEP_ID=MMETSP0910-20130528/6210_1 /TAXON_ID=49265 /ORGANISM="Thalassiosira rotula, Strain GSO102" /LENGTH=251 /DNA_ID=CAMNT_0041399265 /DNA_START=68 /DNA_END=823 /DNA_ORIENTATION=-
MKSTPQDLNIILKQIPCRLDVHDIEDDDDFPLVLRSPNEVDAELDDINDVKFQLRPRPTSDDDERMATTAAGTHGEDDNDDPMEEADDKDFLPLFNGKIKVLEEVEVKDDQNHGPTFCPFTPPPRLILKPRLRPRPKAKAALRPHASRRVAPVRPVVRHQPQQQQQQQVVDSDPVKGKNNVVTKDVTSLSYPAPFPFLGRSAFKNNATPLPKMCAFRPTTMNVVSSDVTIDASFPRLSLDLTPVDNDSSKN